MNLSVVYCNHQTAPLAVRERLAFPNAEVLSRAYDSFRTRFPSAEVVVLSTCNRVELYAARDGEQLPPDRHAIAEFMAEFHGVATSEFRDDLREQTGPQAVRHLFEVASSLDSLVLGEPQIVSQVREAYESAARQGVCGPLTHALFQGAIRASSRVRTETKLSLGRVSVASVAVGDFGKSIFESFVGKRVLVIGAGEMAIETLRYLKDEGASDIVVINRSGARAEGVAAEFAGRALPWGELDHWLGTADVIVSTTGAAQPIVDRARFSAARKATRNLNPVFVLDLAAPRDFAADVGQLDEVFLYDVDALQRTCEANRAARVKEVELAQRILDEETDRFMSEFYRRAGSEIVVRLREGWHEVSRQELQRLYQKRPDLEPDVRQDVERTVERIVNKLLHPPLAALSDESKSGAPLGLIDALRRLFGIHG